MCILKKKTIKLKFYSLARTSIFFGVQLQNCSMVESFIFRYFPKLASIRFINLRNLVGDLIDLPRNLSFTQIGLHDCKGVHGNIQVFASYPKLEYLQLNGLSRVTQ